MSYAEQIAVEVLKAMGYREPEETKHWGAVVEAVQKRIDEQMETMQKRAEQLAVYEPATATKTASKWQTFGGIVIWITVFAIIIPFIISLWKWALS